jgi:hypothetical protein
MSSLVRAADARLSTSFLACPAKVVFVAESFLFDIVMDLGFNLRLKRRLPISGRRYEAPSPKSGDPEERRMARAAKELFMDAFLGKDGLAVVSDYEGKERLEMLLYEGSTNVSEALVELEVAGNFVDAVSFMSALSPDGFADGWFEGSGRSGH